MESVIKDDFSCFFDYSSNFWLALSIAYFTMSKEGIKEIVSVPTTDVDIIDKRDRINAVFNRLIGDKKNEYLQMEKEEIQAEELRMFVDRYFPNFSEDEKKKFSYDMLPA